MCLERARFTRRRDPCALRCVRRLRLVVFAESVRRDRFQLPMQLPLGALREAELTDETVKFFALFRQGVACGRRLLGQGRVLLGDLIHLIGCGVDLFESGRLLLDAGGDIRDNSVDLQDFRLDPAEGVAGPGDQVDALADLRRRSVNEPLDLLGRLGGTLR